MRLAYVTPNATLAPFLFIAWSPQEIKLSRPATDQDQKSLPAYMIYQPKQLEDKIRADLSKGGTVA